MRNHFWVALLPLLFACAAGCAVPDGGRGSSWLDQMRGNMLDPDTILVETALIERTIGDSYINKELWETVDELVVDLEHRAALEQNGLRVGQLVGTPPVGFQALLLSKRSCSNPSRLVVPKGKTIPQYLGPVLAHSTFETVLDGQRTELTIDQARFCLDVTPTLTDDGRTRLRIVPKVETGERLLPFQARPEESAWVMRIDRPSRQYPDLGWDVALAPGQYLIVCTRLDRPSSYGYAALVQEEDVVPVQRLLVIRTSRLVRNSPGLADDPIRGDGSTPLAVQAAVPAYRGKGQ